MTNTRLTHPDLLCNIFCYIDDLSKLENKLSNKSLWIKPWTKPSLSISEIATIIAFWMTIGLKDFDAIYRHICSYHRNEFPTIPTYKSFISLAHNYAPYIYKMTMLMCNLYREWSEEWLKYIDSTAIKVCWACRIINHKVCKWVAQRWKTTQWRFYGFKLHFIVDEIWKPLSFLVTPWNVHDSKVVKKLAVWLKWPLIWDAWYISEELCRELAEMRIDFTTWYRKNMKKLVTKEHTPKMKKRQRVEITFSCMKHWTALVSSFARSVWGHISRIFYSIFTYTLRFLSYHMQSSQLGIAFDA